MPNTKTSTLNFDAINKLWLSFKDKKMEALYERASQPTRKLQMRLALLFVSVLYFIVAFLDFYILPEASQQLARNIHVSQAIFFITLVALSLHFKSQFFHTTMIVGSVCMAWLNHFLLENITTSSLLFSEAYLMVIWVWLITGLPFRHAAMVSVFFILFYELNAFTLSPLSQTEMVAQHFFIYVSFIFGALAGYLIEFHKRHNFLNLQKVSIQANELTHTNALLASEKNKLLKLSQAVEQSDEAILIANEASITEYINPAFTTITGFQENEVIGKVNSILQAEQHPDMWNTLQLGNTWRGTMNAIKKDGDTYPALVSVTPIKNNQHKITHYVSTLRDMTEQEHLENQLRQAQKMEALGTLVGGIAHDFNNTLTGITGTIFLAKEEVAHLPNTLKKLSLIEDLSFQAADMIKQLLAFARKGVVNLKPMSLTDFLQDVSKLHKVTLPSQVTFTQELYATHNLIVRADANQLQQVIINLLNNAKDAVAESENPYISLRLDTYTANADFKAAHPELQSHTFARITISDNGHGISKDKQNYIFEPFYTTKDIDKGSGLGLSMAFGAIQSHGGLITITSTQGKGATFKLYLPLIENETVTKPSQAKTNIHLGNNELILLVDDDPSVLMTGSDILKSLGYQVVQASDGLQALDVYKRYQNEIRLVVLDIAMPKMDGIEAAKQLRNINPEINIIFVTGFDLNQKLNVHKLTIEKVILKPFKVGVFSQTIKSIMKKGNEQP
ncbi:hybrid sensor histidine kinase/response regulator [Ghiorsea bivora]|uniref:hybrid sensor histidine kinase/response regulator n=1 Tax=Ghiorsea bivora TaxID=1485545 RepID=UPI00068FFB32|nr:response regulator [Ghiorsea bivora]